MRQKLPVIQTAVSLHRTLKESLWRRAKRLAVLRYNSIQTLLQQRRLRKQVPKHNIANMHQKVLASRQTLYVSSCITFTTLADLRQNDGKDDYDLPAPTADGAVALTKGADSKHSTANGVAPEQERWARDRVGWEPRFGTGETAAEKEDTTNLLDHQTFLESKLDDKFYGGLCTSVSPTRLKAD